ncbi:MAG: GumC family protein, partial [Bryobacteraceae bacterium]
MKQLPEPEQNDGSSRAPARYQYVEVPPPEAPAEVGRDGLMDYWRILRRQKGIIFLFVVCGVLVALLFSLSMTPVYQARTTLEILNVNENVLNTRDLDPTASNDESPEMTIQTQVKILQSRSLAESVLKKTQATNGTQTGGDTTRISAWRNAFGLSTPQPLSQEQLVSSVLSHLKVQALARTRLVEVSYDSTDAASAARFLNQLAEEFIDRNVEVRWEAAQKTGDWLTRQLEDLKIKLERAEDQLQKYARAEGLQFTGETENVVEEKLKQVQQELSNAQAARVVAQSRYELVSRAIPESLPEILDDRALADYQAKLTELRRQRAELTSTLTPAHYKVKRVEAQIETLEAAFNRQRANVLARIHNEYEAAKRRERLLAKDYAAQSAVVSEQAQLAIHYTILKREVDTHRQVYEAMLQKVKEYGIASAMHASNVRVVDPAQPPRLPYKPNYPVNSSLGLISGLLLGVMFVVVRERADRSIQTPGDAPFYLDLPELGVIPAANS